MVNYSKLVYIILINYYLKGVEYIGNIPFEILKPVLAHLTPNQLERFESFNPVSLKLWYSLTEIVFRRSILTFPNEISVSCERNRRIVEETRFDQIYWSNRQQPEVLERVLDGECFGSHSFSNGIIFLIWPFNFGNYLLVLIWFELLFRKNEVSRRPPWWSVCRKLASVKQKNVGRT